MLRLDEAPVFARLSRVELARLLPEVRELELAPGDTVDPGHQPHIYVVRTGRIELVGSRDGREAVVAVLSDRELFGQEALVGLTADYFARAVVPAALYRVPAARVATLLEQRPELMRDMLLGIALRLTASQQETVRAKLGLFSYSRELWSVVDREVAAGTADVARITDTSPAPPLDLVEVDPWALLRGVRGVGFILALVLAYALYHAVRGGGGDLPVAVVAAVLAWSVVNWVFDTMPDYVVATAAVAAVAAGGIASTPVALSGFANSTWFLSLAVLGVGTAIARSGLLFRVALYMLRLLPPTYWGQSLALGLSGLLLTPVLPSPSARAAIASPLAMELAEAMGLNDRSRGTAGLAMSVLLGYGQMYFLFLNGTGSCILMWNLLPRQVREDVTWGFWLLAALPLGLVVFAFSSAAILWLLRPERPVAVSRDVVAAQIATLGPMSRLERVTLAVVSLVLLAFVTQAWHGIDPAWTAVGGLLYLIATGILERDSFRRGIDWNFLMLYGATIGLAEIMEHTGVSLIISAKLTPIFEPILGSPGLFLAAVALTQTLLRVALPMIAAPLLMAITLYPLALSAGINPFTVTLAVQVTSYPWFMPHQNPFYQTVAAATEGRAFTHRQVRVLALVSAALTVVSVPLAIPFWRWLGLVP